METKNIVSIIVTILIISFVVLYIIALDNRYKQIYGQDYFDIWKRKIVKAQPSDSGKTIIEYPLLKSRHEVENPDVQPSQ
jgi:hypothetical protein